MHRSHHVVVRGRSRRGLDVGDDVRHLGVAGFGEMDLVADPGDISLGTVASGGIGGWGSLARWAGTSTFGSPSQLPGAFRELSRPAPPQYLHRGQLRQP